MRVDVKHSGNTEKRSQEDELTFFIEVITKTVKRGTIKLYNKTKIEGLNEHISKISESNSLFVVKI